MKVTKKVLSVFLAVLMSLSCMTAALPSLVASAASSYSKTEVQQLVRDGAAKAGSQTGGSNAWNYTDDDGTVLKAAEAIYDYAVNGKRNNSWDGNPNASSTLASALHTDLGFTAGSNEGKLITAVLNPNGTTVYPQSNRQSHTGNFENESSWSNGRDLTSDGNVTYNDSVPNNVTKTSSVTINVAKYFLTFNNVNDIPSTFPTKITYTLVHTNGKTASQTSQSHRTEKDGCNDKTIYKHFWTSYKWNYLSSVNRKEDTVDTESKGKLLSHLGYFSADRLDDTVADLLKKSSSELKNLNDVATKNYNSFVADFGTAVINHFCGEGAVEAYLTNVDKAMQLAIAKENMIRMLGYIDAGYTKVTFDNFAEINVDELESLYANAEAAYKAVSGYSEGIFAEVKAANPELEPFSLEASKAFLDELNDNISLYHAIELKGYIDADLAANRDKVADPLNPDDITDLELAGLKDKFIGYNNTIYNTLTPYARDTAFSAEYLADMESFSDAVQTKIDTRAADVEYEPFYSYFIPYLFENIGLWTNEEITNRYTQDSAKQSSLKTTYNKWLGTIGEELVNKVFSFTHEGNNYLITDTVDDYIARLKTNIISRNNAQLEEIKKYSDMSSEVNFTNFIGVKSAIANLDEDLYTYAFDKGWVDDAHEKIHGSMAGLLNEYNEFVSNGGLNKFRQTHYHDASGLYVTRYAGDQKDAAGNQLGFINDIARAGAAENYDVTIAKVNETIKKLDSFLTSDDFCSLVGLKDKETGEAYSNLSEAIESVLSENLFNDEMVNTIVGSLFPMLCNTIDGLLGDLSSLDIDGINKSPDASAAARLDLGQLTGNSVTGQLDLFVDGNGGTNTLVQDFESLGVYLYPQSLANVLSGKYPQIASSLRSAGRDWSRLVGADGKTKLEYEWGVTDYDSFVAAVGDILGSILPLLQCLLAGKNYDAWLPNNFARAKTNKLTIKNVKIVLVTTDVSVTDVDAVAKARLQIGGQQVYKNVWIPVMEALNVTDGNYDLSGLGINGNYKFKTLSQNASGADIADALFEPLLVLIEQLKYQPIDKVLDMLPQLFYALSMDKLQDLINGVNLPLQINLEITDFNSIKFGVQVDWLANMLKGTINGALPEIKQTLNLGSMVNLKDMLGFEYTNINELLAYVLGEMGVDLQLPIINAGELIVCSSYSYVNSARGGSRLKFTADKPDAFYFLLTYLVGAVGNRQFIENIIKFIQNKDAAPDGEAPDDGTTPDDGTATKPIEIPEVVYSIIAQVNSKPKMALAALVELFVPQRYATADMDWFNTDLEYTTDVDNFNPHSIPYIKYSNDWTRDKANYMMDNVDALLESVLKMTGSDETSVNAMLQKAITGMFNNMNITNLVKGLVTLGYTFKNDFVYDLFADQMNVELRTWAKSFGHLFPEIQEKYPDAVIPENIPAIAGVTAEKGTYTSQITGEEIETLVWSINGTKFVDGNRETFLALFTSICTEFAPLISMMLSGEDFGLFNNAITILGYENYANSIGIIFEILGFNEVPELGGVLTQSEYNALAEADPANAFNVITNQLFDWVDYMLEGNTIKKTIELLPRFLYFVQSNGLSTSIHNLLMPLLTLLDELRPIVDVDVNTIVSVIVSDLLNAVSDGMGTEEGIQFSFDINKILEVIGGTYEGDNDPNHKFYAIDLGHLTLNEVIQLVDKFLGTDLYGSELVQLGLNGMCASPKEIPNSVIGTAYGSTVTAADAFTIFVTSLLEAVQYEVRDEKGKVIGTNGEIICDFIQPLLNDQSVDVKEIYNTVIDLIGGLEVSYETPNWGYMFEGDFNAVDGKVTLPQHSIVYLGYSNDWTQETADRLDATFDELVDLILKEALPEGETIATLINSILEDNVYTDANLTAIVEMLVNAIASLDETLRDAVDTAIDTDIASWFEMCELTVDDQGNEKWVCTMNWGVDAAAEGEKKTIFVNAVKQVIAPANELLAWLFFGDSYNFFTGSEKDAEGNYIYNDVISLNGGEGYAFGIVPILEALGCTVKAPAAYKNADGTYNAVAAVEDVFNALLTRIDEISGKPAHEVLALLPNLIYFLNADGVKASVNSLIAPVNAVIEAVAPLLPEDKVDIEEGTNATLGSLLKDTLGFDITDLTIETILKLVKDNTGIALTPEMFEILRTFYIGELTQFTSANGEFAYKMTYTDDESRADMITIVLSFALDVIKDNREPLKELLGENAAVLDTILELINLNVELVPSDPDWFYMTDAPHTTEEEINAILADENLSAANISYIMEAYKNEGNLWTEETATKLNAVLVELVNQIIADATEYENLNAMFSAMFKDGKLYSEYNINKLGFTLGNLLSQVDDLYLDLVGAVLDLNLDYYKAFEDPDTLSADEIEAMKNNILSNDEFAAKLVEMLEPVDTVLDWILFGDDFKILLDNKGNDAIVLHGTNGYADGLAPILEALDIDAPKAAAGASFKTMALPVFTAIMDKVDEICNAQDGTEALQVILDMLPEVIYFINSNGLGTSVNNLLLSVNALFTTAAPLTGMEGTVQDLVNGLIAENLEGVTIDLNDIRFNVVSDVVNALIGINIQDSIKYETYNALDKLFVGKLTAYESATGRAAYKAVNTPEAQRDLLATILCAALDVVKADGNAEKIDKLLGEDSEIVQTVVGLLGGLNYGAHMTPDWFYMAETAPTEDQIDEFVANSFDISAATVSYIRDAYTKEGNLWTYESAAFLSENLVKLVDMIVEAKKGADLNTVLNQEFAKGKLYSEYNIQKLGYMIGDLLKKLPDAYLDVAGIVLDLDLDYYKQFDQDPDEALKDNLLSNADFAKQLADMLRPVETVLDWLLFGKDATFLYSKDGSDAITLKGNEGYKYGLAPILEALQIDVPALTADSTFDTMVEPVFLAIMDKIDQICNAGDGEKALDVMLNHIPNVVYFLNAGGLTTSVNNLLAPVNALFTAVAPLTGKDGDVTDLLNQLLADEGIAIDLKNIDFKSVSDILVSKLGLNIQDAVAVDGWNYLGDIFIGEMVPYSSTTGEPAYRAMLTADGAAQRDLVTIILCAALDALKYPDNKAIFVKWFGENTYQGIMNVFNMKPDGTHQELSWMFVDENGNIDDEYKDKVFSPIKEAMGSFNYGYDEYWTRDKAEYVAANLNDFINGLIKLLGVQIEGVNIEDIGDIVESLIGENLYTNDNAAALAGKVSELVASFADYEGGIIADALKSVLGIDLSVYEKYAGGNYDFGIATGDTEAFMNAVVELLEPLAPILRVILTGDNLTLLVDKNGGDAVTVYGAEGYKYGIIPLLEAFDRNNELIMTAEEYEAAAENDDAALIKNILVPLLAVVDHILEDPLNNLLAVMPSLVYFIDSNGIDTIFQNIARPVTNVLTAIEPITGHIDLYDVIGVDLAAINFQYLINMLTEALGDKVDAELVPLAINSVSDMTMGKLVEFTSKNGDRAYTMEYVEGEQTLAGKADMLTVILRFALKWITLPENQPTIKNLIKQYIPDEKDQEGVIGIYDTFITYLDKPHGINMMLGVLYYVFYGLDVAVEETNKWFDDTNGKWQFIMGLFDDAESDYLKGIDKALDAIFGITDDVIDDGGLASDGLVPFFQKIINWFKSIIEWFKALFNRG